MASLGDDIKALAGFTELRSLRLYGQGVTDEAMKAIGGMKKLEDLDVGAVKQTLTDAGLKEFAGLTEMRRLPCGALP